MGPLIAALPHRLRHLAPKTASCGWTCCQRNQYRWRELAIVSAFFVLCALALRGLTLGNPLIHADEEFYLLVGDRMLHGALPYVDIWDRKPVGLFLLFAGMRLLGGDGIVAYQLMALLSTVLTSLVIYRIAREISTPAGAFWAGIAYQCYLSVFYCFGGQAPVYYNLPMALAGLGMLKIYTAADDRHLFQRGLVVMVLVGLCLQIKYTVVFEGGAFGLALMWRAHQLGWRVPVIAAAATGWCLTALTPTLAAWGYFVHIGQGPAFAQANFLSIFGRHEDFGESLWRLLKETLALFPYWLAIFVVPRRLPRLEGAHLHWLHALRAWATAAVIGFLAFGTWYDHYVAPLLVPLSALCAPALGRAPALRWPTWLTIGFGLMAAAVVTGVNTTRHGSRQQMDAAVALIRPELQSHRGSGCLYINEGDSIVYHLTGSCLMTRWAFPAHLSAMPDAEALGGDPSREMTDLMARHPAVVMISVTPLSPLPNLHTRDIMMRTLDQAYEPYADITLGNRPFRLYRLRHAARLARLP